MDYLRKVATVGYYIVTVLSIFVFVNDYSLADAYPAWWCIKYSVFCVLWFLSCWEDIHPRKGYWLTTEDGSGGFYIAISSMIVSLAVMWLMCISMSGRGGLFDSNAGSDFWKPFLLFSLILTVAVPVLSYEVWIPYPDGYIEQRDKERREEQEKEKKALEAAQKEEEKKVREQDKQWKDSMQPLYTRGEGLRCGQHNENKSDEDKTTE